MFPFLSKKKMVGGLVFGPAAWLPDRIEDTFDAQITAPVDSHHRPPQPVDRQSLIALLDEIRLQRTCNIVPALVDQIRDIADRHLRGLVLDFLPTQPEFVIGAALTRLALSDLVAAIDLLQTVLRPRRTFVVLDRHDFKARRLWKRAAREHRKNPINLPISRKTLLNRYPQAHPTILARGLTGDRLRAGSSPSKHKLVIVDPVSLWALGRYLRTGQPFDDRPVQLFTQNTRPRLVMARLLGSERGGEFIEDFAKRYGASTAGQQVLINGMLTGEEVDTKTSLVTALTESVALREPADVEAPSPCLACGWCVDVCPTALTPVHLMQLAQKIPTAPRTDLIQDSPDASPEAPAALLRSAAARESLHCIACGLCSYVCPTRLPLMQETLRLRLRVLAAQPAPKRGPRT